MPVKIRRIQLRRDTLSNWQTANPVLSLGEPAWVIDEKRLKIGDGSTAFNSLDYLDIDFDNANVMGTVLHLSNPVIPRPDFETVMWIGSVEPVLAENNDLWVNI